MMHNEKSAKSLYEVLALGVSIIDFPYFYEVLMGRVPVSIITKLWFLENLMEINKRFFEFFKRFFDILGVFVLGAPSLLFYPFVILAIKSESKGPAFIKQERVGKNGKVFKIIKFRSMVALSPSGLAEENNAIWSQKEDKRITKIGKFIRTARIDELPQLWNVLKNEMSFIGPRPERPEFIKELEEKVPHYSMRHLVKPGLSGWAQINLSYGASVEYALKKLQYDLYYIKNRSLTLEAVIALKTIFIMMSRQGR